MKINRYERYDSRGRTLLRNEMGLGRERERERVVQRDVTVTDKITWKTLQIYEV